MWSRETTSGSSHYGRRITGRADQNHLGKVQQLLASWVAFVREGAGLQDDFTAFPIAVPR